MPKRYRPVEDGDEEGNDSDKGAMRQHSNRGSKGGFLVSRSGSVELRYRNCTLNSLYYRERLLA